jgi:hypothetical protein
MYELVSGYDFSSLLGQCMYSLVHPGYFQVSDIPQFSPNNIIIVYMVRVRFGVVPVATRRRFTYQGSPHIDADTL